MDFQGELQILLLHIIILQNFGMYKSCADTFELSTPIFPLTILVSLGLFVYLSLRL